MTSIQTKKKIIFDSFITSVVVIIAFIFSSFFDVLEQLAEVASKYEEYEIDELISTSTVLVVCLVIFSFRRILDYQKTELQLKKTNSELQDALNEIKILKGVLPICMYCKNIRDENGDWYQMEEYIRSRSEAEFSHGMCPECFMENHPECQEEYIDQGTKQVLIDKRKR